MLPKAFSFIIDRFLKICEINVSVNLRNLKENQHILDFKRITYISSFLSREAHGKSFHKSRYVRKA